jgi:ABC-2 type transport system permease protein
MNKLLVVLKFEFAKTIKSKPFRILTLLMVIIIAGVLSYPMIKQNLPDKEETVTPEDEISVIGINNKSSYEDDGLIALFSGAFSESNVEKVSEDLESSKALVKDEEYKFIVIIDDEASYTLVTQPTGINDDTTYKIDSIILNYYKAYLLTESGLSPQEAQSVLGAQLESTVVETGKNQGTSFMYTYVLVFGLYMVVIIYGQLVATSVASEKSSRAMEVLVTTVNPVKMMFGKVLGTGLAALCQVLAVVGSGVIFYRLNAEYWGVDNVINTMFNIPTDTIIISILMFVLGFFVYAFIYAAIGSLASRVEDINTSILPITFVSIASFMLVMFSMMTGNIDSTLMKICSWFPLTSPFALLVRASMTDLSIAKSIGAIGVLLLTSVLIGYLAAAIYKMGVLLYGKPPKISEIFKLLKKKEQ